MIRIDDRLLHGQVVWGWINNLSIERVILITDSHEKMWIEMAKTILPDNIEFITYNIQKDDVELINKFANDENTLVIIKDLNLLNALIKKGLRCKEVIIGGLHPSNPINKKIIYAHLTDEDIKIIRNLENTVRFYFQDLPSNEKIEANRVI